MAAGCHSCKQHALSHHRSRIVGHGSLQSVKAKPNLVQSEAGRWLCLSDLTSDLAYCQQAELTLQPLLAYWRACFDPKACCVPVAAWLQRQGAWRRRGVAVGVSWAGLEAVPDDAVGAQRQGVRQAVPLAPGPCWLLKLLHYRCTVSLMQLFWSIARSAGPNLLHQCMQIRQNDKFEPRLLFSTSMGIFLRTFVGHATEATQHTVVVHSLTTRSAGTTVLTTTC